MSNSGCEYVTESEIALESEYADRVKSIITQRYKAPKAQVRTFGCQQNVADSQRIKGMLSAMGFDFTDNTSEADLVLFNTCAVREHAEDRVFGNVGALKAYKEKKPDAVIALCGCMMQQNHVALRIKKTFPFVDIVFGTHVIHKLPTMLFDVYTNGCRVFDVSEKDGVIAEGIPVKNDGGVRGWLPVMYGCNNFCTYCIVPYVRGRERSRTPENILSDLKNMIAAGIKDITLLGQNVNSYDGGVSFARLLRMCNAADGDFVLRFMTSHPKDCNFELLKAMAECEKVEKHLHLPVQSGNDRILKAMNRKYTRQHYLSLIDTARSLIPDIMLTSDIIIGFPTESEQEAMETVSLIKQVNYQSLYTFIYSRRKGTPAAEIPDTVEKSEISRRFSTLLKEQEIISDRICKEQIGKTFRVLVEECSRTEGHLYCRTLNNFIVETAGDKSLIGSFINVKIIEASTWILKGEII